MTVGRVSIEIDCYWNGTSFVREWSVCRQHSSSNTFLLKVFWTIQFKLISNDAPLRWWWLLIAASYRSSSYTLWVSSQALWETFHSFQKMMLFSPMSYIEWFIFLCHMVGQATSDNNVEVFILYGICLFFAHIFEWHHHAIMDGCNWIWLKQKMHSLDLAASFWTLHSCTFSCSLHIISLR